MSTSNRLVMIVGLLLATPCALAQTAAPPPAATTQSVTSALRGLAPAGVSVQELRQEGDLYVFKGTSPTNTLVSDFMRKTMASPGLNSVELRMVAMDGSLVRYEISIKVDCNVPGATRPGAACGAPGKTQSVNKCRINGTLTFQAAPCPAGSEG